MEGSSSRPSRKRPFFEDDPDSSKAPSQKRVRFPKGKKVKPGDEAAIRRPVVEDEEGPSDLDDPRLAAKARATRRSQITAELFSEDSRGIANDISAAEVAYEDNDNFVEDGIQIEPFNLNKEREEGYFDADGNFVEYVNENEIKDAWLDSVEAFTSVTSRSSVVTPAEEDTRELSSDDIGKMKRRIANLLEPGETVLQALRRLKGSSGNRKEKMSAETKHLFDQLTEDAVTLMENGEYNVYHETREVFEREAEGYERLAWARNGGTAIAARNGNLDKSLEMNLLSEGTDTELASCHNNAAAGTSDFDASTSQSQVLNGGAEEFDMFAEDDEKATINKSSEEIDHIPHGGNAVPQSSSSVDNAYPEAGESQSDYVYDESSGYYYSSSLGYYYDPSTRLYCSAASGQWYAFNEETGTYEEVQADVSNTS
ncbi:SUPPRESSOR OF ABI3-5 [Rhodamnia argentea]|uniref:SUPPRESSOR OF ABI3-5 n=1 Tax=Rhodamnia argentea TaxID=178133 RepID=A0A8B8PWI1_9MYRT|nr:SUPPRESSOR OF ABI3-5 [Rhodamnia argentea]